jgi:hypothetical protein
MGGKRIPVTGERNGADVICPLFRYQLKVRRALPDWLFSWLAGIVANAAGSGSIGVLVLRRPRRPRRDGLVVVRWSDWVQLHGVPDVPDEAIEEDLCESTTL